MRNLKNKLIEYKSIIIEKIKKMNWSNWVALSLWLITFCFLITTIVVAGIKGNMNITHYSNVISAIILCFALFLFSSIIWIVGVKYHEKKRGEK